MDTIRLTTSGAIVRYLIAQRTELDGERGPLFPGVFAIFGHGNVTCLGEALEAVQDRLPTWRGTTSSRWRWRRSRSPRRSGGARSWSRRARSGRGRQHGHRGRHRTCEPSPRVLLSGDTFVNRVPDPVLQQVEPFGDPTVTVNDAFRPLTRYWDRIVHPAQLLEIPPPGRRHDARPRRVRTGIPRVPQDVQAEAFDFPAAFFEPRVHRIRRPGPDPLEVAEAAHALRAAERPLLIAGGGVHYSLATEELAAFAERHGVPVVETVAGKSSLRWDHPMFAGPIGVTGSSSANALAGEADVVLAVGTRLQDFTTGSWSVFGDERLRLISLNAARHDVAKHLAVPLVADARRGLEELDAALAGWRAPAGWPRAPPASTRPGTRPSTRPSPRRRRADSPRMPRSSAVSTSLRPRGLRPGRGGRSPRRAEQALAIPRRRHLRL